ncbi:hypothetical protein ACH5RR_034890 [Cinchona calisaya]|uniref:Uncharacterized protein n=1 Tax=Cinchona calisaya TaxID=153742 RepID=A0ABD2YC82_9GENT
MEATMEGEETRKKYPLLPSNYVSLAQLQERWLQKQQQQQKQEEEEKEKGKGKGRRTMENQSPEKQRKDLYGNRQRNKNGGGRRIEGQRVFVPRRVLDGNFPKRIGVEEFSLEGASGVEGGDGVEKKIKGKGKEKKKKKKKYYDRQKRMGRIEGGLIGEDQVQKLSKNQENLGCSIGKNGGQEEGCSGGFEEGNGDRNRGVEENLSLCTVEVLREYRGKEVDLVGMGGKCGGNEGFGEGVRGNSDDWGVKRGVSVCKVEVLPENDELGEEVLLAGNGDDQACRVIEEVGNVRMVEVVQGSEVEEDVSVGGGRKNGEVRYQEKMGNSMKWRVSKDTKVQLGRGRNEEVEKRVFKGENEWNGDQKRRIRRGLQAHQSKERISGNLWRNVRRDLRVLSLGDSRQGNVTAMKGLCSERQGRYGKSRDGGFVWVKKGVISDTNAAEI